MKKSKECKKLCKYYNSCGLEQSFGVSKCDYFEPYENIEDKREIRKEYGKLKREIYD